MLGVGFRRHLNVPVWFFGLTLNSEEPPFDFFENCSIVVNHPAVETNLNWGIGNQQVLAFVAVEVFDSAFLIAVAAAEITSYLPHWLFLLVSRGQRTSAGLECRP